jgi:hypothetical protein
MQIEICPGNPGVNIIRTVPNNSKLLPAKVLQMGHQRKDEQYLPPPGH